MKNLLKVLLGALVCVLTVVGAMGQTDKLSPRFPFPPGGDNTFRNVSTDNVFVKFKSGVDVVSLVPKNYETVVTVDTLVDSLRIGVTVSGSKADDKLKIITGHAYSAAKRVVFIGTRWLAGATTLTLVPSTGNWYISVPANKSLFVGAEFNAVENKWFIKEAVVQR
jgi:hypothetical protein